MPAKTLALMIGAVLLAGGLTAWALSAVSSPAIIAVITTVLLGAKIALMRGSR